MLLFRRRLEKRKKIRGKIRVPDSRFSRPEPGIALPQDPDRDIALSFKCVSASSELTKRTEKTCDRYCVYNIDISTG
jgi:hypothetical protein